MTTNLPILLQKSRKMQDYLELHRSSLLELDAGHEHRRIVIKEQGTTPLLIYSNPGGGIGDRVKGILGAFLFALCTNRVLLIDYHEPTHLHQVLIPAGPILWNASFLEAEQGGEEDEDNSKQMLILDNQEAHEVNQDPGLLAYKNPKSNSNSNTTATTPLLYNRLILRLSTNSWGNFSSSSLLGDLLEPYGNVFSLEAQHDLFYTLFQFTPAVQERANALLSLDNDNDNDNDGEDYIAVHVRTGDSSFITEFWKGSGKKHVGKHPRHAGEEVPEQFFSCAKKLQNGMMMMMTTTTTTTTTMTLGDHDNDDSQQKKQSKKQMKQQPKSKPKIYVASDEDATKQKIRDFDPESVVLAKNMTLLHVGREDQKGFEESKVAGHLDAWAEILILANAACIVGSRSGYSDLAVALSNRQRPLKRCGLKFWECNQTGIDTALENLKNER